MLTTKLFCVYLASGENVSVFVRRMPEHGRRLCVQKPVKCFTRMHAPHPNGQWFSGSYQSAADVVWEF